MPGVRRRLLPGLSLPALVLALALPGVAGAQTSPPPSAGHQALAVGIADQKTSFLIDERFTKLGLRHARLSMPWDVLDDPDSLEPVDVWIRGTRALGIRPLITFDRSRRPGRKSLTPSPGQFGRELQRIRRRWPWLREFSTWNEANINRNPKTTAQLWLGLERACPSCTILGADLLDRENVVGWAQRFAKAAGRWPRAWGLHNYVDANRFSVAMTRKLLRSIKGELWLTETGGVVERNNGSTVRFAGAGGDHAARATAFVFDRLVPLSRRITRVYLYHWDTPPGFLTWDSGFVGPDGAERPALGVLRGRLQRLASRGRKVNAACTSPTSKTARPSRRSTAPASARCAGRAGRPPATSR